MDREKIEQSKRYIGLPAEDIPSEYDREAVESALDAKPSKRSKRVPWKEYSDLDDSDDPRPEWHGTYSQDAALEAGRCGAPLKNVRRFGHARYCTRLPERRMGQGNWKVGSDFCTHHSHLEKRAVPAQEVFDLHPDDPLPYME